MFNEYLNQNQNILEKRRLSIRKNGYAHIHQEKFSFRETGVGLHADKLNTDIFYNLIHMVLARRIDDY